MNAPRPTPHRARLPPETPRPRLVLKGSQRRRMMALYLGLHAVVVVGFAVSAATIPGVLLAGLLLAYFLENTLFVVGHVGLHCSFMETPEREMPTVTHHSFLHHYRDIHTYHKSWLASRLSYFYCPRLGFRTLTAHGTLTIPVLTSLALGAWDWRVGLCALSCMWGAHLLQTIAHEWTHHPDRKAFYARPTHWFLSALEWAGIVSTARHIRHHRHHLHNLDQVHEWVDLYIPGGEWLGRTLFTWARRRYVPGERRMVRAIIAAYAVYIPLHFGALAAGFWLLGTWLA